MIYQIITASSYLDVVSSSGWDFLIEDISLALFVALVILMIELWLVLRLLSGLTASLLLYQLTTAAGTALLYAHSIYTSPSSCRNSTGGSAAGPRSAPKAG